MAKLEKILVVLFVVGLAMNLLRLDGGGLLIVVSAALLSFLYWPLGFALLSGIRGRELLKKAPYQQRSALQFIMAGVLGLFLATAVIGTAYIALNWGIGGVFGSISLIGLMVTLPAIAILNKQLMLPANGRSWYIRGFAALALMISVGLGYYHLQMALKAHLGASMHTMRIFCV
jgi:hypothetical protein